VFADAGVDAVVMTEVIEMAVVVEVGVEGGTVVAVAITEIRE
jgi:hypothetical protein